MHRSLHKSSKLSVLALAIATSCNKTEDIRIVARYDFARSYCSMISACCEGLGSKSEWGCVESTVDQLPLDMDLRTAQACLDAIRASSSAASFCNDDADLSHHNACRELSAAHGKLAVGAECKNATTNTECDLSAEGRVGCVYGKGRAICTVQLLGSKGEGPCVADTDASGAIPPGASVSEEVPRRAYYCDRSQGLHCGEGRTCVEPSAVGGPCRFENYECVPGAYCDTKSNVCKTAIAPGQECPAYNACQDGSYCEGRGLTQVCAKLGANGESCRSSVGCASGYCAPSGSCATGFAGGNARLCR